MTQQYRLASMAVGLSSTGISHHNLLPHIPWNRLSTVNSSPHPGIVPQFLNSSSQTLPSSRLASLPRDCLILIPFRQPQIHCFSLKCFSSDSDNCPDVGIGPLLQFPHRLSAGPVLLTLLFSPLVSSSYRVFVGLYILFLWPGTPVRSQLVFCMHFCV